MESLYNLTEKSFKFIAIFLCFLGDLVVAKYAWLIVSKKELFEKVFLLFMENLKKNPEYQATSVPKNFFEELFQLSMQATMAMITLVVLLHVINYMLYYKDKVFAYKYVKLQAWMGGVGLCFLGFPNILEGGFNIILALSGVSMIYVGIGMTHFKAKNLEPKASSPKA